MNCEKSVTERGSKLTFTRTFAESTGAVFVHSETFGKQFLGKIKNILVLLKETFFDIMQLSYTTDGSGNDHREYSVRRGRPSGQKNAWGSGSVFLSKNRKSHSSHLEKEIRR